MVAENGFYAKGTETAKRRKGRRPVSKFTLFSIVLALRYQKHCVMFLFAAITRYSQPSLLWQISRYLAVHVVFVFSAENNLLFWTMLRITVTGNSCLTEMVFIGVFVASLLIVFCIRFKQMTSMKSGILNRTRKLSSLVSRAQSRKRTPRRRALSHWTRSEAWLLRGWYSSTAKKTPVRVASCPSRVIVSLLFVL